MLTLILATAPLIGCGGGAAIHPVVKQAIPPDKALKRIDPFDPASGFKKKGGLSGN